MANLSQDAIFAVRLLRREPAFALTAVFALGLGIGINNMLVTIIYGHTLRGLPIERADRVMYISMFDDRANDRALSYPEYLDVKTARSFSGVAAFLNGPAVVGDDGRAPDRFDGAYVSDNAFEVLRIEPIIGRVYGAADDGAGHGPIAMLGSRAWQARYGGDPSILGRSVLINGTPTTVVGIVPDRSGFPSTAQVWLPLSAMPGGTDNQRRDTRTLRVFGRLRDEATVAAARSEIESIVNRLSREHSDTSQGLRGRVVPISERFLGRPTDPAWLAFITAGFLVLVVACANVANLLLARAALRAREMAVRASLGATRARVVTQLLAEAVVLATLSGIAGLLISVAGVRIFSSAIPANTLPYWINYTLDLRVFAALVAVSFASILVFGVTPAWQASRVDVNRILKDGGRTTLRSSRYLTTAFLTAQFALTVILLAHVVGLFDSPTEWPSDAALASPHLLTASVTLPADKYRTSMERAEFYRRLDERLHGPGGITFSTATVLPVHVAPEQRLQIEGRPVDDRATVWSVAIGPRYFETLSLPVERGREFSNQDSTPGRPAAIVNRQLADTYFAGRDPLGERIRIVAPNAQSSAAQAEWLTVVGVAPNIRQRSSTPDPIVYVPLLSAPPPTVALIVRNAAEQSAIVGQLRQQLLAVDPRVPLDRVMSLTQAIEEADWNRRLSAQLVTTLAILTLGFAVLGLYAVMTHAVSQRMHEIGIRVALGASPSQLRSLVIGRAFLQVGVGLIGGIAATMAWDAVFYTGFQFADPAVLAPVAIILTVVTLVASALPARRAARIDAILALRDQ